MRLENPSLLLVKNVPAKQLFSVNFAACHFFISVAGRLERVKGIKRERMGLQFNRRRSEIKGSFKKEEFSTVY